MTVQKYAQQIEHLLLTGAIQNNAILELYRLLKAYEQKKVEDAVIQKVIDQHDPDKLEQWFIENLPPLFDEVSDGLTEG